MTGSTRAARRAGPSAADSHQRCRAAKNHSHDLGRHRAKGDADANLAAPLRDDKCHEPVDANRGHGDRDDAEEGEHHHVEPPLGEQIRVGRFQKNGPGMGAPGIAARMASFNAGSTVARSPDGFTLIVVVP
jgi:hypothetical protein